MPSTVEQPQEQELKQQALTVVERAKLVVITDQASYDKACSLLLEDIKPFRKKWESYWKGTDENPGPIKLAYKSYQSLLDKFNEYDKPAESAEKIVKAATVKWEIEQEEIKQRLQREAQEKAEREERERQLQAAIVAEDAGASDDEIEAIISAPIAVVAPPVAPRFQRASGMSKPRDNWKCRVNSIKMLCKAIGSGQVKFDPSDEKKIAEFFATLLGKRASAEKSTFIIPGCVAYNDPIAAGRTK